MRKCQGQSKAEPLHMYGFPSWNPNIWGNPYRCMGFASRNRTELFQEKLLLNRKVGITTIQRMLKHLESLDRGLLSSQRALQILVCTVKGCSPNATSSRLPVSPADGGKRGETTCEVIT